MGIIHTNYLDYARREEQGDLKEKFLKALNSWVCRVHCHKVSMAWAFRSVVLPCNACCGVFPPILLRFSIRSTERHCKDT